MIRERSLILILGLALAMAACGGSGGGGATAAPGQTAAGGATAEPNDGPGATDPAAETEAPADTPGGGGGGGGAADACSLLTVDEVMEATGTTGVVAQPVPSSDTDALSACAYLLQGVAPAISISILDPANTETDPGGYLLLPGSVEVAVSGASAVFVPAAGFILFVFKGDSVAAVAIGMPKNDDFEATARSLAQKVADRL